MWKCDFLLRQVHNPLRGLFTLSCLLVPLCLITRFTCMVVVEDHLTVIALLTAWPYSLMFCRCVSWTQLHTLLTQNQMSKFLYLHHNYKTEQSYIIICHLVTTDCTLLEGRYLRTLLSNNSLLRLHNNHTEDLQHLGCRTWGLVDFNYLLNIKYERLKH